MLTVKNNEIMKIKKMNIGSWVRTTENAREKKPMHQLQSGENQYYAISM